MGGEEGRPAGEVHRDVQVLGRPQGDPDVHDPGHPGAHHVDAGKVMLGEPKALSDQPSEAIALDGISCRFHGDRQAHPRMREAIRLDAKCEKAVVEPATAEASAEAMAQAILKLLQDPDYLQACKQASRRAAEEVFFWENEEKKLLALYESLEISKGGLRDNRPEVSRLA